MSNLTENGDNEKKSCKKIKNKKNKKITKSIESDDSISDYNVHKNKLNIALKESIKKNKWFVLL
jgi:hypothetical protein